MGWWDRGEVRGGGGGETCGGEVVDVEVFGRASSAERTEQRFMFKECVSLPKAMNDEPLCRSSLPTAIRQAGEACSRTHLQLVKRQTLLRIRRIWQFRGHFSGWLLDYDEIVECRERIGTLQRLCGCGECV